MRAALGASSIVVLAIAAAGCASSPKNDHDAITQLWKDYFDAIDSGDAAALAKLYPDECGDVGAELRALVTATRPLAENADFEVTDVQLQNLNGSEAESMPIGQVTFQGEPQPIESDAYTKLVKEGGGWKFAECNILGGGFFDQSGTPTPEGENGAGQ